ncbi:MAG: DNA polymerase III subunit delta [Salinivirgaceae bacterium]
MASLDYEKILTSLEKKEYQPVYYLFGEEGFFIDQITNKIATEALPEEERSFNQTIMYGSDVEVADIVMAARRFPMMAEKQVIIVKEGQEVKGIAGEITEAQKNDKKENPLTLYINNPMPSTILVINYRKKKLDKRTKFYKTLTKNGIVLESKKLWERDLNVWIEKYINSKGYSIVDHAVQLLSTYLGNDLEKLVNELNKLAVILPPKSTITATHIQDNVGISKDYNAFELWSAIASKNRTKAHEIAFYFSKNIKDHHIAVTITVLFTSFTNLLRYHQFVEKRLPANTIGQNLNLNYYKQKEMAVAARNYSKARVVRIIGLLRHYDARSKGVMGDNSDIGELTKELVATILFY